MPLLTNHDLRVWADDQELTDLLFAESDYRLVSILEAIYGDTFLAEQLLMKGGTAINKLYLGETSRLSLDLDFNHIGPKEKVLGERRAIREQLCTLLREQDKSYATHWQPTYGQTTIKARYKTLAGPIRSLKIEISHVERFPILPSVQKQVKTPKGPINAATYTLAELTSTKLRALMERLKGRDIYDLYYIFPLKPDPTTTRKMFLYYFYKSRKVFNPNIHYQNLTKKYENNSFADDVSDFVKPTVKFNLSAATKEVISSYSFLSEFDSQDRDFLQLGSMLLGRNVPKEHMAKLRKIKNPLAHLFKGIEISKEARAISTNEIKPYRKHKPKTGVPQK